MAELTLADLERLNDNNAFQALANHYQIVPSNKLEWLVPDPLHTVVRMDRKTHRLVATKALVKKPHIFVDHKLRRIYCPVSLAGQLRSAAQDALAQQPASEVR